MALPNSRNRSYGAGSPVVAADMNDFQDQIIAAYAGRRGPLKRSIHPMRGNWDPLSSASGTWVTASEWAISGGAAQTFFFPLEIIEGERILEISVQVQPTVTAAMVLSLKRLDPDGSSSGYTSPTDTSGVVVAVETLTIAPNLVNTAGALYYYAAEIYCGAGSTTGAMIGPLYLTTDIP